MLNYTIAGHTIEPGKKLKLEVPLINLYTGAKISMPLIVCHGLRPGPSVFLSAAIHGDELNGIEIIRRVVNRKSFKILKGTVLAVPTVNVLGVLDQSRYMPDRRDLNRTFPGSNEGSLASRVAHVFMQEVVSRCEYGIDLHTGAIHRSNLPQIRADLSDKKTRSLARAFGTPVILNADLRDGSLRQAASEKGIRVLLYEAGEALRYDEFCIRAGVKGIQNVLHKLGMIEPSKAPHKLTKSPKKPYVSHRSLWVRASASGFIRNKKRLGDQVYKNEVLADIIDSVGEKVGQVIATREGIIIGKQNIPLAHEGEALYHIACFDSPNEDIHEHIEHFQDDLMH